MTNHGLQIAPPPVSSTRRRFGAWALDQLGMTVAGFIVALWARIGVSNLSTNGSTSVILSNTGYAPILLALISAAYTIPLWSMTSATFGQRLLHVQVVDRVTGASPSVAQAATRWLGLFGWALVGGIGLVPSLTGIVGLVQVVWLAVLLATTIRDSRHQGIHDRLAGSAVVRS